MNVNMGQWGPATVLTVALVLIAALTGAYVVLFGDQRGADALAFADYLDALSKFAIGVGLLGIGRGVMKSRR